MKLNRYFKFNTAVDTGADNGGADVIKPDAVITEDVEIVPDVKPAESAQPEKTALEMAAEKPVDKPATVAIPDKFQVKKEDGTIDVDASSLKMAEAYSNLEKKVGSHDAPPKTAADYKITVPDALKETWQPADDQLFQDFKADALKAGINQKQFDFVMDKYFSMAPSLLEGNQALDAEACIADLRKDWKTDVQYKAEVGKAFRAASAYGDKDASEILKKYGNDPMVIKMLARIGSEMKEDTSINAEALLSGGESVESLIGSPAYSDPKDPNHKAVSAKVRQYYEAKAAADERAGRKAIM